MKRQDLIQKIKRLLPVIGHTRLGKDCGKYFEIQMVDDDCIVLSFEGKYGYGIHKIEDLKTDTLRKIYIDLSIDFDI
jgi:hypothetical protein